MRLEDIKFPIFPIRSYNKIYEEHKIIHIETAVNYWIIDNKNLSGDDLASRRFKIKKEKRYPLTLSIFTIGQLLRYKSPTSYFIDSLGYMFKYSKSTRTKLSYYRVDKYVIREKAVLLFSNKLPYPIYIDHLYFKSVDDVDNLYVGLLDYRNGHLLYELTNVWKKETWRKI